MIRIFHSEIEHPVLAQKGGLATESEQNLAERQEQALSLARGFIKQEQWKQLIDFIALLPDNDPLVTQTDFLQNLQEEFFSITTRPYNGDEDYWEYRENWKTFFSSGEAIKKMANNPNSLSYLQRIIREDHIPPIVVQDGQRGLDSVLNIGVDEDDDARWIYYRYVVEALVKMKTAEAYKTIGEVIKKIYRQQDERFHKQMAYNQVLESSFSAEPENDLEEDADRKVVGTVINADGSNTRVEYVPHEETPQDHFNFKMGLAEQGTPSEFMDDMWSGEDAFYTKVCIIKMLGETESIEAIPIFLDIIKEEQSDAAIYFPAILEAIRKLDQNTVASQLLEMARSSNEFEKRSALWLLYHLEIGQVGVSTDGVHYLQHVYDVGEFNSPNFYVERVTSGGQVGIFAQSGEFQKYFKLEGLDSEQQKIQAQLLDITYATLYGPHPKETVEERAKREGFLAEFKKKYFGFFHGEFFQDLPIKFSDLSFAEQGQFMKFYESSDEATRERILSFCKKFGLNGFRTFLSLDYDQRVGARILELGEKQSFELSNRIFEKYGEILAVADIAEQGLNDLVSKADLRQPGVLVRVKENLLVRAKDLLVNFSKLSKVEKKPVLLKRLEECRVNIAFFVSVARSIKESYGTVDFNAIKDASFEVRPATQVANNAQEVSEMETNYSNNYQAYPADFRNSLIESLRKSLTNPHSVIYSLKHEGRVKSSCRFDKVFSSDGKLQTLYFGAFNTDPLYAGGKLGEAMLEQALEQELKNGVPIEADCDPKAPIAQRYMEMGFRATGFYIYEGVPSFSIILEPNQDQLMSKSWSKEAIVKKLQTQNEVMEQGVVLQRAPKASNLQFELVGLGYNLTRYFTEGENIYCVYEKPQKVQEAELAA